jgi:hypothetical protein
MSVVFIQKSNLITLNLSDDGQNGGDLKVRDDTTRSIGTISIQ